MLENKKILLAVGIVLLVLIFAAAVAVKFLTSFVGPVTITYWGLWEPDSVFQSVIEDYKRIKPNVTISYKKMSPIKYREKLMSEIATDSGPDIVRIHNSWVPMMKNYLAPIPNSVYSVSSFKETFYPVAVDDLTDGRNVWAVPLEIDTILMFVNDDLLSSSGLTVPATWEEFSPAVGKMTVVSDSRIQTGGTALGNASNVDHWQEIVGLMMLQAGVNLNQQANSESAGEALGFYTGFSTVEKVWDETQDASTLAFASGKVGFYFGPSWRYFDIKNINPNLKFHATVVPQLQGSLTTGTSVNYATYWAEAVSKKSKNVKEAAEFLKFISSKEELTKLYANQSKIREFGEPYSRRDLASTLSNESIAGVVISTAPSAKSWYLASVTNDGETGINSKIGKYYTDAINAVNSGMDIKQALETVATGVSQVLGSYAVGG